MTLTLPKICTTRCIHRARCFKIASQESGHQVPDSAERLRRINASVLGHDQAEWLAGVLGWLQTMEASLAALSGAADFRPAVAVTDPPTEVERRRSALQFTRRPSAAGLGCFGVLGVALGDGVDGPCQDAGESFGFQEESEVVTQLHCRSASYTYCCYFGVPGDCSPGTEAGTDEQVAILYFHALNVELIVVYVHAL